ncbi:MAG: metallophosphoesterase [Gemmatimonadota bacterium]|nr:MAG: metallophosphoesterase [Gemmatimonadota bacterium]
MKTYRVRKFMNPHFLLAIATLTLGCSRQPRAPGILIGPYVQNVKTNSITIMWESSKPENGKVLYGEKRSLDGETDEKGLSTIHEITLTGLKSETRYYYRVQSGKDVSDVYSFKTAVMKESPFSFASYGDNRDGPVMHRKITNLIASKNPDFVIHNGDLVNKGPVQKQWGLLFFNPAHRLMSQFPLYPVLGNHEENSEHFYNFFSLPNNERWYSFDYGKAHFIMLDSDDEGLFENGVQHTWLIDDLKKKSATWTFVTLHVPPFTAGGNYYKRRRIRLKNVLHTLMERYGVDIVFSGHDHNYERTRPIVSKNGAHPVTYVIAGNGGTPMRYIGHREWTLYAERVFGFVLVQVDGKKLLLRGMNIENEVIDELILDKDDPASMASYEEKRVFFEDIVDPVETAKYYGDGDDLVDEERYEEAIILLEKAYAADTTCIQALAGVARCRYELGQYEEALSYAMRGIRKMPNYPDSYEVLIDVLINHGKYDEALEWCQKWLLIEPDSPDANETMSKIYEEQKQYDLAIEEMMKALAILPSEADLYFRLGQLYETVGQTGKAVKAYQMGLDWFTDDEPKKMRRMEKVKSRIQQISSMR